MNREEFRVAFWKKESKSGNTYYSGKLKIGDKEYQCSLFKNNKTNKIHYNCWHKYIESNI